MGVDVDPLLAVIRRDYNRGRVFPLDDPSGLRAATTGIEDRLYPFVRVLGCTVFTEFSHQMLAASRQMVFGGLLSAVLEVRASACLIRKRDLVFSVR